ncbi:STK33-like protein [Mya arenaria]|uniref:STK33-like protein n=1 Tax=Mya arenaria TaxID=6604 RepID=A0ABY7EFK0_MYAAR|nr:STK33-like protein [Mya arenaria]
MAAFRSSLVISTLKRQSLQVRKISTARPLLGAWHTDWKPSAVPRNQKEHEEAAKKYGLPPEDYHPLPEDIRHGDYPDMPNIGESNIRSIFSWLPNIQTKPVKGTVCNQRVNVLYQFHIPRIEVENEIFIGDRMTSTRKGSADKTIPHTRLEDEAMIWEGYENIKKLGEGSFGKVYQVRHRSTDIHWAMKFINKDKAGGSGIKLMEREVTILKRVSHPNIIQLNEVFETSKRMYLVMELCSAGELADTLKERKHFMESEVKVITKELASAIHYLHKHAPEIIDNKTYSQQCDIDGSGSEEENEEKPEGDKSAINGQDGPPEVKQGEEQTTEETNNNEANTSTETSTRNSGGRSSYGNIPKTTGNSLKVGNTAPRQANSRSPMPSKVSGSGTGSTRTTSTTPRQGTSTPGLRPTATPSKLNPGPRPTTKGAVKK